MPENLGQNNLKTLFYIPSFYGAFAWGVWLALYPMNLVRVDDASEAAACIYLVTELFFVASMLIMFSRYQRINLRHHGEKQQLAPPRCNYRLGIFIICLHLIGFVGLVKWCSHLATYLGGYNLVIHAFFNAADLIRGDTELPTTIGIQLAYFGWIGIAFTAYGLARKQLSRWWLVPALVQLAGNFLFIARTQPVWIMFTSSLVVLALANVSLKKTVVWLVSVIAGVVILFWIVAEWTGKTYYEGILDDPRVPGISQVIYAYGVSGFAYFNHMLVNNEPVAYKPQRVFYPVLKILSRFGLAEEPPSQILEFYGVPYETNVGSFLEPFYRDGGFLFVLFGILIYSFGLDFLGLKLLESGRPLELFAWSNICFTTLIGFLTPKVTQFPFWLFIGLGLASLVGKPLHAQVVEGTAITTPGGGREPSVCDMAVPQSELRGRP